ncbi:lycopene cyclase domain-containing protein [Pedobacter polaris]|uniref:Lycopene cyclase domain-containing protein n=1 Tax=Pedobacter polaris TaxID=2571273 RepID=A0A4U1CWG4_9SPHI|nr:lycopene cyclase domain-containing protein [Pedobacter polaris]TKC13233.1 lycopene cyclase domain-containing protein [Pedobacter polaris]
MTYTFLLLNLFLILIPFVLALDKRVFNVGNLRLFIVPSLIVAIVFSLFAIFLTGLKAWSFNSAYIVGLNYGGIPIEEYIFMFTFSFAGLGIYNYLNAKYPKNNLQKYSLTVSQIMIGICFGLLFFAYAKWYTALTFAVLMLLLIGIEYINTLRFMYKFYRAFLVTLIPFYICYGIICNLPVIHYEPKENVKFDLAKIPLENHFFMMAMLLLAVYLFEFFSSRKKS